MIISKPAIGNNTFVHKKVKEDYVQYNKVEICGINTSQLKVLKEKDYITKPKQSGYSSYHLIIDVPVNVAGKIIYVKVEIQVRTMAMDFWASLEHEIKYKTDKKITKKMSKELIQCAKLINKMDLQMTNMAKR